MPTPTPDAVVTDWRTPVFNLARRIVRNDADAEDLAQDILLQVCARLDRYDASRPFEPWLYRTATRVVFQHLRGQRRRRTHERQAGEQQHAAGSAQQVEDTDVDRRDLIDHVQSQLRELPDEQRALLTIHFVHGQSYATIADGAGLAKSTVQSRIERALEALRGRLAGAVGAAAFAAWPAVESVLETLPQANAPAGLASSALLEAARQAAAAGSSTAAAASGWLIATAIAVAALAAGIGIGAHAFAPPGTPPAAPLAATPAAPDNIARTIHNPPPEAVAMPSLTRIVFSSNNPPAMAAFYTALLGAQLEEQDWGGMKVATGKMCGVDVLIVPAEMSGVKADANRHQLGFTVDDLRKRLADGLAAGGTMDEGWEVQPTPTGLSVALRDPDGNSIEMFETKQ
ncbi:MAG: sigma-70 family RNA polymerase sigma factor [Planctomycetota bacterium]